MINLFLEQFSIQLRFNREACGLSQQELSERLHIGYRTYQRFETGESIPSLDVVYLLSKELKFKLKDIFSPSENIKLNNRIKFYTPDEESIFMSDPLVNKSRLLELAAHGFSEDYEELANIEIFNSSPYPLVITTPKNIIFNPKLKSILKFQNTVRSTISSDMIRELGVLWASLIESNYKYFEERRKHRFPSGNIEMNLKSIFLKKNNRYIIFSVVDI